MTEVKNSIKNRNILPYWNSEVGEISKKLWAPTEINLNTGSFNGLMTTTVENSWFSMKCFYPNSVNLSQIDFPVLKVETFSTESINLKSKKIRFYPSVEQKQILKKWMGTARSAYNSTIAYLQTKGTKASWMSIKTELISSMPEWAKETPYQIKSLAINDACIAVKNAKRKYSQTKKIQKVKFRSKKAQKDSIYITKSAINSNTFYPRFLGKKIRFTEQLPPIEYACRMICENGKFYICIPVKAPILMPENQRMSIVALDPGVRTFQTFYSPLVAGKLCENGFSGIYRLCYTLDRLISKMSRAKCKQKRRMRKAAQRIREKIKNLINEAHHKIAYFLCKNFNVILLPHFETSHMVTKLRSKVSRAMLSWAHFRFKTFLKHKAKEMCTTVIDVNESYTSKTCSMCGQIHNIGSRKVMKCNCGSVMDRDLNGARGILLRALVDTPLCT